MLKNILKLKGAQKMGIMEQKEINGGILSNYCNQLDTCIKGIGNYDCVDNYQGVFYSLCNCCIMPPL